MKSEMTKTIIDEKLTSCIYDTILGTFGYSTLSLAIGIVDYSGTIQLAKNVQNPNASMIFYCLLSSLTLLTVYKSYKEAATGLDEIKFLKLLRKELKNGNNIFQNIDYSQFSDEYEKMLLLYKSK